MFNFLLYISLYYHIEYFYINNQTVSLLVYKNWVYRHIDLNFFEWDEKTFYETYYYYYKKPFVWYFLWLILKNYLVKYWQYNLRLIFQKNDINNIKNEEKYKKYSNINKKIDFLQNYLKSFFKRLFFNSFDSYKGIIDKYNFID